MHLQIYVSDPYSLSKPWPLRKTCLTLTRDWQPPCCLTWLDRTVDGIMNWLAPVRDDSSKTIGSWGPAPSTQWFAPANLAELIRQGTHTSTATLPNEDPPRREEFILGYAETPVVDATWSENLEIFRPPLDNPLNARDQISSDKHDHICQEPFVPVQSSLLEVFNDCRRQQLCS